MIETYLLDIGFSDKEAKVYLSLLQMENSSVLTLAHKTGIKRSTVYMAIESLAKRGLVSETTKGKKTFYLAGSPELLEAYIERKMTSLDSQKRQLKDIIPQIKTMQREVGEKPLVQYFEGKEGIYSMNESLYKDEDGGGTAYLVYSKDLLDKVFKTEEKNKLVKVRLGQKVKTKVIYNYSQGEIANDATGERVKIDETKYPFNCDISVYKDRVRVAILGKKLSGIFIRSQEFADTLKNIIMVAFDSGKVK